MSRHDHDVDTYDMTTPGDLIRFYCTTCGADLTEVEARLAVLEHTALLRAYASLTHQMDARPRDSVGRADLRAKRDPIEDEILRRMS